jgi:hypothetical protein
VNALRLVKGAALIVPLLIGIAIFVGIDRRPALGPPQAAAPQDSTPATSETRGFEKSRAALMAASGLMASGRVQAARATLLRVAPERSADVAWTLARSYDPNFLSAIPAADAGSNVAEAIRWYRTWYDIAVQQGLVADSVSLDRIIRSMN